MHSDALDADEAGDAAAGRPRPDGVMAVIAAGTGLGQAQLVRVGGRPLACASEGGHADFAPRHRREDELVRMLRQDTAAPRSSTCSAAQGWRTCTN